MRPAALALIELAGLPGRASLTDRLRGMQGHEPVPVRAERALAASWCVLPKDVRNAARAIEHVDWIAHAARALANGPAKADTRETVSACLLVTACGAFEQARTLTPFLDSPIPRVADAAANTLRRLAARESHRRDTPAGALQELATALADAIGSYERHRRSDLVAAGAALLDRTDGTRPGLEPLRSALLDSAHPGQRPMLSIIRRAAFSAGRERAWRWLREREIARQVAGAVHDAEPADRDATVLEHWHLALHPVRSASLADHNGSRTDGPEPAAARAGPAARVLELTRRAEGRPSAAWPERLIDAALVDEDPAARLTLARAAPPSVLPDLLFDANTGVARFAADRWSSGITTPAQSVSAPSRWASARGLRHAPWVSADQIAESELDALVGPCLLSEQTSQDDLTTRPLGPVARASLRGAVRRSPRAAVAALLRFVRSDDPARAAWGLQAVVALDLARPLAGEVARAAHAMLSRAHQDEPTTRALASAASAIRPGAPGSDVLRELLEHDDARVRANATETVGVSRAAAIAADGGPDGGPDARWADRETILARAAASPHHRVRTNAAVALRREGPAGAKRAAELVLESVRDPRAPHRLAGAWAAGRIDWSPLSEARESVGLRADSLPRTLRDLVEVLADRAAGDAEPRVRARMSHAIRRIRGIPSGAVGKVGSSRTPRMTD